MMTISELFAGEREALADALAADQSVSASLYAARNCFDHIKQKYIAQQEDQRIKAEAAALFAVARRTLSACEAVRETRHFSDISSNRRTLSRFRPHEALPRVLPIILSVVACLVIYFTSKSTFWSVIGIAAALGSLTFRLWPRLKNQTEPSQAAMPSENVINTQALLTTIECICSDMDNLLGAQGIAIKSPKLVWTKDQLSAVQILWEALRDRDGAYALSAIPSILNGLENQGVRIMVFSPETERYFETIPAESDGVTVRPAFLADGVPIAKGRVTEGMLCRDQTHAG